MGTGSGIQAVSAAGKPEVERVVAADVNPSALEASERRAEAAGVGGKISFVLSDLFDEVEGEFDWILFNPPYLPSEGEGNEASWTGGERGVEIIERFLSKARRYLKPGGSILLVYSSQTGLEEDKNFGYVWEVLEELPLFYETLYCSRLSPS